MANELIDLATSLTQLMEEESEALALRGRMPELTEVVVAKVRLAGQIESEVARLERETPGWNHALPEDERAAMADTFGRLRDASIVNAQVLERQIAFSSDLMSAIAGEAQRATGKRRSTYGAGGDILHIDLSAPISVNACL